MSLVGVAATVPAFPLTKEVANKQSLVLDKYGSGLLLPAGLHTLLLKYSLSLEHGEGPCKDTHCVYEALCDSQQYEP